MSASGRSSDTPRFLPLFLGLSVLLWCYTMTGGRQVFVKEVLGGAYDSQAEFSLYAASTLPSRATFGAAFVLIARFLTLEIGGRIE
jgi:hypothetical protein